MKKCSSAIDIKIFYFSYILIYICIYICHGYLCEEIIFTRGKIYVTHVTHLFKSVRIYVKSNFFPLPLFLNQKECSLQKIYLLADQHVN